MRSSFIALVLFASLGCGHAPIPDTELRSALLQRADADQGQMRVLAAHMTDSSYHRQLGTILLSNAAWLDSIVARRGWPGFATADSDGAAAAFLIAQHADALPKAQQRFLVALRAAVRGHDARPIDMAFLEDRVRKAAGRPQLYGTQAAYDSTGLAIQPDVELPESLDVRRAAVGLPPMGAYLEKVRAVNVQLRALHPQGAP